MMLNQLLRQIQKDLEAKPAAPLVVMIAGGSATGKSSYILPRLQTTFGEQAVTVEQDWYQQGLDFAGRDTSPYRWDDPQNFQLERLATHLRQLCRGEAVEAPAFDVLTMRSNGSHRLTPRPVIIVDGLYTLLPPLRALADYSIYTEMPLYGRFLRRLFRFIYEQGQTDPQTPFKQVLGSVLKAHHDFVGKQAAAADTILTIPYDFAETIDRYQLQPSGQLRSAGAEQLWEHQGLAFQLRHRVGDGEFYIMYRGKCYYHFSVEKKYLSLLRDIDFFSC